MGTHPASSDGFLVSGNLGMPVTSVATSASTPVPWQRLLETSREEEHDILEDDVYRDIKCDFHFQSYLGQYRFRPNTSKHSTKGFWF